MEFGFIVETPSEDNDQRVIIVTGKDTVQCFPTAEQAQRIRLCEAVRFEESSIHPTDPRTVEILELNASKPVATCFQDPEDPSTVLIKTKIVRSYSQKQKRFLVTDFFEKVSESLIVKHIGQRQLNGSELIMKQVNFSRWEIKEFIEKEQGLLNGIVYGVLPGRPEGSFRVYVPGYPKDFSISIKKQSDIEYNIGKWISFHVLEDGKTVDEDKAISFTNDPYPTRKKRPRHYEIMVNCSKRKSELIYSDDLNYEVRDIHNSIERYDLPVVFENQKLWIECSPKQSNDSIFLAAAEFQEQLGSPKRSSGLSSPETLRSETSTTAPASCGHNSGRRPPSETRPSDTSSLGRPPRGHKLDRPSPDSLLSDTSSSAPPPRGHNPRSQPSNYKFVKPSRKLKADGTPVLPGEAGKFYDYSSSTISSSSSDDSDLYKIIARLEKAHKKALQENKQLEEQLNESKLEIKRKDTQIHDLNKTNHLISSQLSSARLREEKLNVEKQNGDEAIRLMRDAMNHYDLNYFLKRHDPELFSRIQNTCNPNKDQNNFLRYRDQPF